MLQVRHADVAPDAVAVFLGLGVALCLEIISIYHSGPAFWAVFCIVSDSDMKSINRLSYILSVLHHRDYRGHDPHLQSRPFQVQLTNDCH